MSTASWPGALIERLIMVSLKRIVVATDFGEAAGAALAYGRELARTFGASLDVLHVVDNFFGRGFAGEGYMVSYAQLQQEVEDAAARSLEALVTADDRRTLHATPVLRMSMSPAQTIVDYASGTGADLIVMGTHGHGAVAHLLMGSVAERVVRMAPCPVLTVHHPEHDFVPTEAIAAAAEAG